MSIKGVYISLIVALIASHNITHAQEVQDSVKIHFRQGYSTLETSFQNNQETLNRIANSLRCNYDSSYQLRKIAVIGGASPEGSVSLNERLSKKRAHVLFNYLSRYIKLPDSLMTFRFLGRDWNGLLQRVKQDTAVPHREETIAFLEDVIERCKAGENETDNHMKRFALLCGGAPYRYAYQKLFPDLRASLLVLTYEKRWEPIRLLPVEFSDIVLHIPFPKMKSSASIAATQTIVSTPESFYMALRNNLLEDLALVPNIGVEFYLGNQWSIGANWKYAWWKSDRKHNYWRIYGGDLNVRKYFGQKAKEKPLQGHHLGVYGQIMTYDFELGEKGVMGGIPGGNIFDKFNYGIGIEYGYSHPIAKRLNLDFTIGLGYFGGEYREYIPMDDCYVWQATKERHYWGPTKAEISLVWLIGRGNVNNKKESKP